MDKDKTKPETKLELFRRGDQTWARLPGPAATKRRGNATAAAAKGRAAKRTPRSKPEEKPVRLVWARPLTAWGGELAVLDAGGKEVALLANGLDDLDPESRAVAENALDADYLVAEVKRVERTRIFLGNRYWEVATDRGRTRFLMPDPNRDIIPTGGDGLILRDSVGNRYRIPSTAALDKHSRAEIERVV